MMKKFFWIAVLFPFVYSCSEFREQPVPAYAGYENVGPRDFDDDITVVNLTLNPSEYNFIYENFWGDMHIYGRLEIFRNNQPVFVAKNARFGFKGSGSRVYDLKSLGVRFEEVMSNVDGQIIQPDEILSWHNLDRIESIRLRNSGNDFSNRFNATMIKDISYTRLAILSELDLDVMYSEQAVVFLNEEFLGVMNIRSESNARGIAGLYRTTPDKISLAKVYPDKETDGVAIELQNGNYQKINNLLDAIANRNIRFLKNEVDVNNFIDYIIFNTFIANRDWPNNNVKIFAIEDQPFRFFMFDLDHANISHKNRSPLTFLNRVPDNPVTDLFYLFYEEEDFQTRFYKRFSWLLASGHLAPERFREIVNKHYSHIDRVMPFHIEKYRQPAAMAEWYRNVELLNVHYEIREAMMQKYILEQ